VTADAVHDRKRAAFERRLRRVLDGLPAKKVAAFIECANAAVWLNTQLDSAPSERERRRQLRDLRKATDVFASALGNAVSPIRTAYGVTHRGTDRFWASRERLRAELREFVAAIDEATSAAPPPPARGRLPTSGRSALAYLAVKFAGCFQVPPTTTPGGLFASVAIIVLEAIRAKPSTDPARLIRQAVHAYDEMVQRNQ
jgi:hypothetical protein